MLCGVVASTILLGLIFNVKWDKFDQNEEVPVYIKYSNASTEGGNFPIQHKVESFLSANFMKGRKPITPKFFVDFI